MPSATKSGRRSAAPTISATWTARIDRNRRDQNDPRQHCPEAARDCSGGGAGVERPSARDRRRQRADRCEPRRESEPVDNQPEPRRRAVDVNEREPVELPDEPHHVTSRFGCRERERLGQLSRHRAERATGAGEHERPARVQRPGVATHRVAEQLVSHVDARRQGDDVGGGDHPPPAPSRRSSAASAAARNTRQIAATTAASGTPSDTSRGPTSATTNDVAIASAANAAMVVS